MTGPAADQEQAFREWMRGQLNDEGIRRYTDNAIIAYCYALRTACYKLSPHVAGNLFLFVNVLEFEETCKAIREAPNYEQVNKESGNGAFGAALELYQTFLRKENLSGTKNISAPFYLRSDFSGDIYSDDRGIDFHYEEVPMKPLQRIYYGAPGTGKSYTVRRLVEAEYPDPAERDAHCKRLIFHPTYTYEDFVGTIKPLVTLDRPLDYVFSAGPLTVLLKEAFLHPAEKYYLIIEEINRGNAPAIFGDLFQLLDRTENGKSEYAVQNIDITGYFVRDPGLKKLFYEGRVWLPANFNILATMNTADENIFVLDSAFKRRFSLEYVRIQFDGMPSGLQREYSTFSGKVPLQQLFAGTSSEDYVQRLTREGKLMRNWPTFARLTNHIIDMLNRDVISHERPELARIPENKKLGPFFVTDTELSSRENFINKVIFYLKQDVFTYSEHYMKESYEDIYLKYMDGEEDLFELLR